MSDFDRVMHKLYLAAFDTYKKDHPRTVSAPEQEEWFTIGALAMMGIYADMMRNNEKEG